MKVVRTACLLAAAHAAAMSGGATPSWAQEPSSEAPEIRTSATAVRKVRPDGASLTLRFWVVDSTPARAGARLAARADSIRRALAALGIPRDSLLTGSTWYWWPERIEVLPQRNCYPPPQPGPGCIEVFDTTYRARDAIEVRIHDLSKVGAVIDAALALRITEISSIRFEARDVRQARLAALNEAAQAAREQAEALAAAGNLQLGRTILLTTGADYSSRMSVQGVVQTMSSDGIGRTEITFPSIDVSMTVSGRWEVRQR